MIDATAISNTLATFAATYLFHSTVLLSSCWLFFRLSRATSYFLVERVWKLAAVMGLLTTLLHMTCGASLRFSVFEGPGGSPAVIAAAPPEPHLVEAADALVNSLETLDGNENGMPDDPQPAPTPANVAIDSDAAETDSQFSFPASRQLREAGSEAESAAPAVSWPPESTSAALGGQVPVASSSSHLEVAGVDAPAAQRVSWESVLPWISALVSVLLTGCVVFGSAILVIYSFRLRTRFATSRPLKDGPARQAIDRFLKRNRIRRPIRLLSSTEHLEPATYGLFSWTIVLPDHTEERLAKEELKALLAHEVAHLVRGDVWWLWVGRLICTCLAFQPLNLIARRQWQQAAEYLCDDWAVERGVRSISLARCLTQIAEWRFGQQATHVGLAAGGTKATLVHRVERLVNAEVPDDAWAKPTRRRLLAAGACAIAIAMVGLTPRFALPFAPAARSGMANGVAALSDEDAARICAEWRHVQEELLQLDAALDRANGLLKATSVRADMIVHINELNRQAASLRARRGHITSLLEKDSQR